MNSMEFISSYKLHFAIKSSSHFSIYTLSQVKTHLIHFKSNGTKSVTKVNVLFEIHALYQELPYLTKYDKIHIYEKVLVRSWLGLNAI